MKRVCREGGRVVLSFPNNNPRRYRLARILSKITERVLSDHVFPQPSSAMEEFHEIPPPTQIARLLDAAGLRHERSIFMGFIERRLTRINQMHKVFETLDKMLGKIPLVKSFGGVIMVVASVSKG